MDVQVLGPLRITVDGSAADLPGRYVTAAIAYLTLSPGRAVPLPELAAAAGGSITTPAPLRRLRADLRSVAEMLPAGVVTVSSSAMLALPDGALDADRFTAAVLDAESAWAAGDTASCRTASTTAVSLWRGDPYPELADCLDAVPATRRLRGLYVRASEFRQELAIASGVDFDVLARARQLAGSYPERRTFRLQLARALHLAGRHVEALAELRETAAVLGDSQLTRRISDLIARRDPVVATTATIEAQTHGNGR